MDGPRGSSLCHTAKECLIFSAVSFVHRAALYDNSIVLGAKKERRVFCCLKKIGANGRLVVQGHPPCS